MFLEISVRDSYKLRNWACSVTPDSEHWVVGGDEVERVNNIIVMMGDTIDKSDDPREAVARTNTVKDLQGKHSEAFLSTVSC